MTGLRLTEVAAVVERASTRLRGEDARRRWQRWCQGCRCRCLVTLAAVWLAGSGPLVPLVGSDAVALVLPKLGELGWPGRFFLAGGAGWMSAGDCSGAVVGPRLLGVAAGLWCGLGTALSAREHGSAAFGSASLGLPVRSSLAKHGLGGAGCFAGWVGLGCTGRFTVLQAVFRCPRCSTTDCQRLAPLHILGIHCVRLWLPTCNLFDGGGVGGSPPLSLGRLGSVMMGSLPWCTWRLAFGGGSHGGGGEGPPWLPGASGGTQCG